VFVSLSLLNSLLLHFLIESLVRLRNTVWFRLFDIDNDQTLSRTEMLGMVKSLWKMHQVKLSIDSIKHPSLSHSSNSSIRNSSNAVDEEEKMEALVRSAYDECQLNDGDCISFDQFSRWFSTAPIALEFHEAIKRVCF